MQPSNFCNIPENLVYDREMHRSVCEEDSSGFFAYYILFLTIITVVNVIGNSLIISTVVRHTELHHPYNYFIFSLAVSDLFAGLAYPLYNLSHFESVGLREVFGRWKACSTLLWLVQSFHVNSSYHLVAITASRFIAVTSPLRVERHLESDTQRVAASLALVWTTTFFVAAGLYLAFTPQANYPNICRYELIYTKGHIAGTLVFAAIVPVILMLGMYIRILGIARKQAKSIAAQGISVSQDSSNKRRQVTGRLIKSTKMVAMLLGFFALGWFPLCSFVLVRFNCATCVIPKYIWATARLLLHMNSVVNIFIYAGRMGQFRSALRKDLVRLFNMSSKKPEIEPTGNGHF